MVSIVTAAVYHIVTISSFTLRKCDTEPQQQALCNEFKCLEDKFTRKIVIKNSGVSSIVYYYCRTIKVEICSLKTFLAFALKKKKCCLSTIRKFNEIRKVLKVAYYI